MKPLFAHQARLIEQARQAYRDGFRSILINSPTGSGKTRTGVELAYSAGQRGSEPLWVSHRKELLDQAGRQLHEAGATLGVGGILLLSVQTLATMANPPRARFVVFDECHHYVAQEWGAVAKFYEGVPRIGLTASPCRHDGRALDGLFDTMVNGPSVRELVELGLLVPCDVIAPAGKRDALADDPVTAYRMFGGNRLAIVYCGTVAHAKAVADQFNGAGIRAACVDGKLSVERREAALAAFRRGELRVLTNVQILTEGTDLPEAEVCILARGISHVGAFLQCIGRVLRICPWTGKRRALLIDLKGSVHQHGLPADDRVFSLTGKPIREVEGLVPLCTCRRCGAVFRWEAECPKCGAGFPRPRDPAVKREILREIRETHSVDKRKAFYAAKIAEARRLGYPKLGKSGRMVTPEKWAGAQFQGVYRFWPPWRLSDVVSE